MAHFSGRIGLIYKCMLNRAKKRLEINLEIIII